MADPVRVASLESIPEALHAHFAKVEVDGAEAYEYRPPASKTEQDVARLDGALKKERERAKQLSEQLQQRTGKLVLDDQELDPDEVKAALDLHRKSQAEQMISVADADKRAEERIVKARSDKQKEIDELKALLAERDTQLDQALVITGAASAANHAESPVRFKDTEDVLGYIREKNLARRNGTKLEFFDLAGEPLTNAKGDPGGWFDVMALVASKKPHWVVESQGAGTSPQVNGVQAPKKKRADMTFDERAAAIRKYGAEGYAALP